MFEFTNSDNDYTELKYVTLSGPEMAGKSCLLNGFNATKPFDPEY
jgi:hypothetical protein